MEEHSLVYQEPGGVILLLQSPIVLHDTWLLIACVCVCASVTVCAVQHTMNQQGAVKSLLYSVKRLRSRQEVYAVLHVVSVTHAHIMMLKVCFHVRCVQQVGCYT